MRNGGDWLSSKDEPATCGKLGASETKLLPAGRLYKLRTEEGTGSVHGLLKQRLALVNIIYVFETALSPHLGF